MTREMFAVVAALFVALLVLLGMLGWWVRRRRQRDIPAPASAPAQFRKLVEQEALYVATTVAGDPYDRIAVHGLGLRSKARLLVGAEGVILALPERDYFTPADALTQVQRGTWTIDRVVEPGGLLQYSWRLGEREITTNVRIVGDDAEIFAALQALHNDEAQTAQAGKDS